MKLPIYQIDAFAEAVFTGNPAAVMPLERWLDDTTLAALAMENNLSETAFLVGDGTHYELRWFTPRMEVDLCGHATLAAAHVLFSHLGCGGEELVFASRSGELRVRRSDRELTLDFPVAPIAPAEVDLAVCHALGATASEAVLSPGNPGKLLYVYEFEEDVASLNPDFGALKGATGRCVIATAPGAELDFVSRFFAPQVGIDEDPVTGSAHCVLAPYWAARLHRDTLHCRQVSPRGGNLRCALRDGRVLMTGTAVTFMVGEVTLADRAG